MASAFKYSTINPEISSHGILWGRGGLLVILILQLYGPLPSTWGDGTIFPKLLLLDLSSNLLTGDLPEEWGLNEAWPQLLNLNLQSNNLTGHIPDVWVEGDVSLQIPNPALS